jgi:hypothetical protein
MTFDVVPCSFVCVVMVWRNILPPIFRVEVSRARMLMGYGGLCWGR